LLWVICVVIHHRIILALSAIYVSHWTIVLKMPKRENFLLAFFAPSETIWVCDLGTKKKSFFYQVSPEFDGFWFFTPFWVCGRQTKLKLGKNEKWWWLLLRPYVWIQFVFWKILKFCFFYECLKIFLRRANFFTSNQYAGNNFKFHICKLFILRLSPRRILRSSRP
jgi:hypothetical protein